MVTSRKPAKKAAAVPPAKKAAAAPPAKKPAAASTKKATSRTTRATPRKGATARRRTTSTTRSRPSRPGLPTTIGTALGTLAVTTLLDTSWPVRIGLLVLVLLVGFGYVLWKARHEIAAGAAAADPSQVVSPVADPSQVVSPVADPDAIPSPAADSPDSADAADDPGTPGPVAG